MACGWNHIEQKLRASGPLKIGLASLKFSLFILSIVLVFIFGGKRTKESDIYRTSDPLDNVKNGVQYTCGCGLPGPLQNAQSLSDSSKFTWNTCYDNSLVETVSVLMYPNFTGVDFLEDKLFDVLLDKFNVSLERKVIPGVNATVEAHDLAWGGNYAYFKEFTEDENVKQLFPGGYRQQDWDINVPSLVSGDAFYDFPASFLVMRFTYWCLNCSSCDLSTVNKIFTSISGDSGNKALWGECVYWGGDDQCSQKNYYQAKCAMYPEIAPVPLVFGIQKFLQDLLAMNGTSFIRPPASAYNSARNNFTSLASNDLHMSLRRDLPGMVELRFLEIEKGSVAWLSLLERFPTLGTECSELANVTTYNGSSVCNLYRSSVGDEFNVHCLDMKNQTYCKALTQNATLDVIPGVVWKFFNVSDWPSLLCPPYQSQRLPPYKVLGQTAPAMQNDVLNSFLQAKWFTDSWALNSGVCVQTYTNVIRYQPEKGMNATNATVQFMEAICSADSSQAGYCWLNGKYRKLNDSPDDPWLQMEPSPRSPDTFVCYNIEREALGKWFLVTFGVLFSWLGTVDLIFKWINKYLFRAENNQQTPAESSTSATPTSSEGVQEQGTKAGDQGAPRSALERTGSSMDELNAALEAESRGMLDDATFSLGIESAESTPNRFSRGLSHTSYFRLNSPSH